MGGWGGPTEYVVAPVLNWTGLGCDKNDHLNSLLGTDRPTDRPTLLPIELLSQLKIQKKMQYQKTKNLTKKVISLCKLTQKQKNLDPKPASKIAQKGKKGSK